MPTCRQAETVAVARERLEDTPLEEVVVVNEQRVVLGGVGQERLRAEADDTPVEKVMMEGPTTVRPAEDAELLVERMDRAGVGDLVVTRSDGTLVGVFERSALEREP